VERSNSECDLRKERRTSQRKTLSKKRGIRTSVINPTGSPGWIERKSFTGKTERTEQVEQNNKERNVVVHCNLCCFLVL